MCAYMFVTQPTLPHTPCCAAGACKILFQLPLIWFILVKYAIAGGLTVVARESITAVAWDSAGASLPSWRSLEHAADACKHGRLRLQRNSIVPPPQA